MSDLAVDGLPIALPTRRTHIFNPPAELAEVRVDHPVCPMRFADGGDGWLITGYAESRSVLTDVRFSARQDLRTMPEDVDPLPAAAPGFFVRMDAPEHTRYRRLVTGHFSRRRLAALVPFIRSLAEEHLDRMADSASPADLVEHFALPIPSLVVGEILGVRPVDREQFQTDSRTAVDLSVGPAAVAAAMSSITALLAELVAAKQRRPGGDLISDLLADGLSADEVAAMAFLLLVAGHETTANMISLGVFALLCHPRAMADFRTALSSQPDETEEGGPVAAAVEELLRYLSINQFGAMRVAREDLDLSGHRIGAGQAVIVSLPAANRDPQHFGAPDRLRLDRAEAAHLAFGHGPHLCSGHQLARLELRILYAALLRRFPGLRLACSPQQVPLRHQLSIYGVDRLPIVW